MDELEYAWVCETIQSKSVKDLADFILGNPDPLATLCEMCPDRLLRKLFCGILQAALNTDRMEDLNREVLEVALANMDCDPSQSAESEN